MAKPEQSTGRGTAALGADCRPGEGCKAMIVGMTVAVKTLEDNGDAEQKESSMPLTLIVKLQTLGIVRHGATPLVPALRR